MQKFKIPKCPKCNSFPSGYVESWTNFISFDANKKGEIENGGEITSGGPFEVEAICSKCEYSWILRKYKQVGCLKIDKDYKNDQ